MEKRVGFWTKVLAGLLIGIGCVLPGVSGGVLAVSFGLYRPMLDAVLGIFHGTRQKLLFLLPLAVGGAAGLLAGAKGLSVAMALHEKPMLCLFTGFIAGGVPSLMREAEAGEAFRLRWLWAMLLGVLLALPLALAGGQDAQAEALTPLGALAVGLLEGVGTVIPGLSTSFVLIRLGWYQAYLTALTHPQAATFVPLALGFAASALLCMKAVKWLFDHAQGYAYYAALGFLMVSVALVFPGFGTERMFWAQTGMLAAGLAGSRWMAALCETHEQTREEGCVKHE